FWPPSRIVQATIFVPLVSIDPRSRITEFSLCARSGTINSASPSTAMLALWVTTIIWRFSLRRLKKSNEAGLRAHSSKFSRNADTRCREADYERKLMAAYPIHPEIFERLYQEWSGLVKFQRTRGVLRLMAAVMPGRGLLEQPLFTTARICRGESAVLQPLANTCP